MGQGEGKIQNTLKDCQAAWFAEALVSAWPLRSHTCEEGPQEGGGAGGRGAGGGALA